MESRKSPEEKANMSGMIIKKKEKTFFLKIEASFRKRG
jgi:hypothetical protein